MSRFIQLHKQIFRNYSPFALAAVAALVIGVGDLLCVFSDLLWLFGDMHVKVQPHHWLVFSCLALSMAVIAASFGWLYWAILIFNKKTKAREDRQYEISHAPMDSHMPTHCLRSCKKYLYKAQDEFTD